MTIRLTNINNGKMKKINLKVVLNAIRQREPISRRELADLVGLTSSSITNIVSRLLNEGYAVETGSRESQVGRKPIMLELNSSAGYAIGVELNTSKIICLLADFRAKKVAVRKCETPIHENKDRVIERIADLIDEVIVENKIPREKVMGIGLVSAGPYDRENGIMINPPNFPGWYNVPIKSSIEEITHLPTYFEKETVAAAIAESWFGGADETRSLFAINVYQVGIGGGIIIDGQVYHGFRDGAGDIGHMTVDPEGPRCSCGDYGCLESLASGLAVERIVKSEIERGYNSLLNTNNSKIESINLDSILRAAMDGDSLAKSAIEKAARYLSIAISNIINVYSPEMVVIGGDFANKCPHYVEAAISYARRRIYPPYGNEVKIVASSLGDEQGALGGVGVVFQDFYRKLELE